uniref:Mucin-16-like n=1 Tax=Phascolarctos cinereus TaxID=38626 RepID=A0A6P5JWY0_PHACI|nr:mucin-16-like [Phascolarctos cinereus]
MESFAVDFTISNLIYTAEMGQPDTKTFSNTKEVLQNLLNPLFESGSIGSYYSGCKLTTLRPVKNGTAVNFLCTYWKLLTIPILDKKKIYWELSKQTRKITRLGPHILEKKSLYINGYNHLASTKFSLDASTVSSLTTPSIDPEPGVSTAPVRASFPPDTSSAPSPFSTTPAGDYNLKLFSLNFSITNLLFTEDMGHPGSGIFNSTERTVQRMDDADRAKDKGSMKWKVHGQMEGPVHYFSPLEMRHNRVKQQKKVPPTFLFLFPPGTGTARDGRPDEGQKKS